MLILRHLRLAAVLCAVFAVSGGAAHAGEIILDAKGDGSTKTASFKAKGPWLLSWRINSDYRRQSAFELNLIDAQTGFFHSRVIRKPRSLNGLKLFRETGTFRFEVNTTFTYWTLVVEELTEAEADAMIPASPR
ncbi:MAG: hypothetical protein AAF004_01580 [Pseudomonadota bacterium]